MDGQTNIFWRRLIASLLLLQVATVATIFYISNSNSESIIKNQAQQLLDNASAESVNHIETFLRPAARTVSTTTNLLNQNIVSQNKKLLTKYLLAQLEGNKEFAGVYIAYADGSFHFAKRDRTKVNSAYLLKSIEFINGKKITSRVWLNKQKEEVASSDVSDGFNPLERPWYNLAIKENALVWTSPYTFFTSNKTGLSVAKPFYNKSSGGLPGVVGVDVTLDDVAGLLAEIDLEGAGLSLLLENSEGEYSLLNNDASLQSMQESNLLESANAGKLDQLIMTDLLEFTLSEGKYLASVKPFKTAAYSTPWHVVTYVPEHVFLEKMHESTLTKTLIAIIVGLISALVAWYLVLKAWKPVGAWRDQAITDHLTGLYNRHHLFTSGRRLYERSIKHKESVLSLVIIDIDDFKQVNDRYGHSVGDEVIVMTAWCMQKEMRPQDIVVRYGGDEFIIILPDTPVDKAAIVIDRLKSSLTKLEVKDDISLSFSLGLVESSYGSELNFYEFIEKADMALYKAKQQGKNVLRLAT